MTNVERRTALALIDGEHHPTTMQNALERLSGEGWRIVGAMFLGGTEKVGGLPELPVPVYSGDPLRRLPELLSRWAPQAVLDLSDEPIVDPRMRMRLASVVMAAGVSYIGGGIRLDPVPRPVLVSQPSVSICGMGKRTGKTALSIELARHWHRQGLRVCIVTMGRGGPPEPLVLREGAVVSVDDVAALNGRGFHAASDYVEGAALAGVATVGTARVGAGPAGATVVNDFAAGAAAAASLSPDVIIWEGSGTAIPPAHADATILVARSDLDPEYLCGYLGPYRLALADVLLLLEVPGGNAEQLAACADRIEAGLVVVRGRLEPDATVPVRDRRVCLVTTASDDVVPGIRAALLERGAREVLVLNSLSDRQRLLRELAALRGHDIILTELKAAAVDTVVPMAAAAGAPVGFLHNRLLLPGGITSLLEAAGLSGLYGTVNRRVGTRGRDRP